jgi:ubiquinone/menaquinone biosynthesis C-methylase UbiE
VAIAKASFPGIEGRVEDGEKLSFPDDSFDFSFIAVSLHHLPRPILGLYELESLPLWGWPQKSRKAEIMCIV